MRRLRQGRERQRAYRPHLLLLVSQPRRNDLDHLLEVGEDAATHEDGYLLDDLDAGVARVPAATKERTVVLGKT